MLSKYGAHNGRLINGVVYFLVVLCIKSIAYAEKPTCLSKLGLENISEQLFEQLRHKRVGLVTNQTGYDQTGSVSTADFLIRHKVPIVMIFTPEHGLHGTVQAGHQVHDQMYKHIPVKSLYGGNERGKHIDAATIALIDCFIIDLQDVGMRHYTYLSTLYSVLVAAHTFHKHVIVLDRPNPLGNRAEGPIVDPSLHSFISIAPIPLRHGLTFGEAARYCKDFLIGDGLDLVVVPMVGYQPNGTTQFRFPKLSPNIQSLQSAYGYSFLGIVGEIRPFNVGVGTQHAFQCLTLPKKLNIGKSTWLALVHELQKVGISGSYFTYHHPKKNEDFVGIRFSIKKIQDVKAFDALLIILDFFQKRGVVYTLSDVFDKAVGTHRLADIIQKKFAPQELAQFKKDVQQSVDQFLERAATVRLY